MMTYYLIAHEYAGPNIDEPNYTDVDYIEISTTPALTNQSHEPRTDGWCGTTDDWSVDAHGAYPTVCAALDAAKTKFGGLREFYDEDHPEYIAGTDIASHYRIGQYGRWPTDAVEDWIFYDDAIDLAVTPATTDIEIESIADDYERAANDQIGISMRDQVVDLVRGVRDQKIDEATQ